MPKLGALLAAQGAVIDLHLAQTWMQGTRGLSQKLLPDDILSFLAGGSEVMSVVRGIVEAIGENDPTCLEGIEGKPIGLPLSNVDILPPLKRPTTLRDFSAFEEHVKVANANRGRDVPGEWYEVPVFYFSNPNAIYGPDQPVGRPKATRALDYELEIACVIGKAGIDIPVENVEEHIAGYTILNDWSARDLQQQEMKVGLGPAKGKDFATSLGPWLVTPDELEDRRLARNQEEGGKVRFSGHVYDLEATVRLNGVERSHGNWKDIYYTFAQMIVRASTDVWLLPGDVVASGTVATCCLLELTKGQGPWLQPGDVVELEVERLGVLRNRVA